jgi:YidC/Oxa1 family membrane protein insertase
MDRRTVWAILLMMAIATAPALFMKRPTPTGAPTAGQAAVPDSGAPATPLPAGTDTQAVGTADSAPPATPTVGPADTVRVTSPLYTYGISKVGGRVVEAKLLRYRSMAPGDARPVADILPPDSRLLDLAVVLGADTISLRDWSFTASADSLPVAGLTPLRLSGSKGAVSVALTYTFRPDDYQIGVAGQVTGVGPNGGQLLLGMGPTIANTEANAEENRTALALVTKRDETERTDFSSLDPGEPHTISGPLDWAAIKSKYFVTAVLAFDSVGGGISGVTATARKADEKRPTSADVRLSLPLRPSGAFGYTVYVKDAPMTGAAATAVLQIVTP